jgi:hypothetical protein
MELEILFCCSVLKVPLCCALGHIHVCFLRYALRMPMQLTPKTASVLPPEDGRLTPETSRGIRHNKAIVKVKVY